MRQYGYARVSSTDQNEARQVDALKAADCKIVFVEKQSGKDFERPVYKRLLHLLKEGDCLFIHSLDRLGRNYDLIKEQWEYLTKKKKINIVVLDMPLLDTREDKNLIGHFISDIVLQLLAFASQMERDNIRKRQAEGIAAAKLRGVRFGHDPKKLPEIFPDLARQWWNGLITVTEGSKAVKIARSTFRNRARELMERETQIETVTTAD